MTTHQPPHSSRLFSRLKRQLFSRPKAMRFLATAILFIGIIVICKFWWQQYHPESAPLTNLQQYIQAFADPNRVLADYQGRTNVLIMGIGGGDHPGATLTDSLMFVSYQRSTQDLLMIPVPRDLWIPSLRAKINSAYYYGDLKSGPTGGFTLAKAAVSEVLDQPIHYTVLIDFAGFEKLIDLLGGIEINVETGFTDHKYPIPGKENAEPESDRYEILEFTPGPQIMEGARALKYVRSRNAEGPQGTDLARSQRQRQVLLAIKDRLVSTNVLLNPSKLNELRQAVGDSFKTDLPDDAYPALLRLSPQVASLSIRSAILPIYLDGDLGSVEEKTALLINPPLSTTHDNQWVLAPKSNSYQPVHQYINCIIAGGQQDQCLPQVSDETPQ